jgi:signal transduction histidine kinase
MQFYIRAKAGPLQFYDIFAIFSALPFMWFLSVALVKVIEIRTKLQESENQRIIALNELELHQAQLETMQETVRALQHHINNPLTVIKLSMELARKASHENVDIDKSLTLAEKSVNRIQNALIGFSSAKKYQSESIDTVFKMASLGTSMHAEETAVIH